MKKTQEECLKMARLAPKLDYEKLYFDEIGKLAEKNDLHGKKFHQGCTRFFIQF